MKYSIDSCTFDLRSEIRLHFSLQLYSKWNWINHIRLIAWTSCTRISVQFFIIIWIATHHVISNVIYYSKYKIECWAQTPIIIQHFIEIVTTDNRLFFARLNDMFFFLYCVNLLYFEFFLNMKNLFSFYNILSENCRNRKWNRDSPQFHSIKQRDTFFQRNQRNKPLIFQNTTLLWFSFCLLTQIDHLRIDPIRSVMNI